MPRNTPAGIDIERARRQRHRLIEGCPRLGFAAELTERGGEPAVYKRMFGIGADHPPSRLDRRLVIAAVIMADHQLIDPYPGARVARVEPDPVLQHYESLPRAAGKDQRAAECAMRAGQVRANRPRMFDFRPRPFVVAARQQHPTETAAAFGV